MEVAPGLLHLHLQHLPSSCGPSTPLLVTVILVSLSSRREIFFRFFQGCCAFLFCLCLQSFCMLCTCRSSANTDRKGKRSILVCLSLRPLLWQLFGLLPILRTLAAAEILRFSVSAAPFLPKKSAPT